MRLSTMKANRLFRITAKGYMCMLIMVMVAGCREEVPRDGRYRVEMREFVEDLAACARKTKPDFVVIANNGVELVSSELDDASAPPAENYLDALDGIMVESLWYGGGGVDQASSEAARDYVMPFLNLAKANGVQPLILDYCADPAKVADFYAQSDAAGYLGFASVAVELNSIPTISTLPGENDAIIVSLGQARNFLQVNNLENFPAKSDFIAAVTATNYDVLITDLFFHAEDDSWTDQEIAQLRPKENGGQRLVICYLSAGEAEKYRYYWKDCCENKSPAWLSESNPSFPDNYKVHYWKSAWRDIVFEGKDAYLERILDAGFDGVFLDVVDAYHYFEDVQ